jgi:nitronate monooxygenase
MAGTSTPALAIACTEAGALGFVAGGYLSPDVLEQQLAAVRAGVGGQRPFGVNLFMPSGQPANPATVQRYAERIRAEAERLGAPLGEPQHTDDNYHAKLALLLAANTVGDAAASAVPPPAAVVSFTFGCPSADVVRQLQQRGMEAWVTVTNPSEVAQAVAAGANALVAQGVEAGGHRGAFLDTDAPVNFGLLPLLQLLRAAHPDVDFVASGGIMTGAAAAAALVAGARAVQLGSAFLLAAESGTSAVHRAAVASAQLTGLSRAWSGRLARGVQNRLQLAHSAAAPIAYPEVHLLTSPLRAAARKANDGEAVNCFAGEAHTLAAAKGAKDIVRQIEREMDEALAQVYQRRATS